jgi:2-dehydropantoate 2-reductase
LAKNQHFKKVVFLGNNLGSGQDILEHLEAEKIILGFGGTTGEKRGDIIYHYTDDESGSQGKIWLGEYNGEPSSTLLELQTILEEAGFETELSPDIDAWLKTHAAVVLPIAFGLYLCGGDNFRLAKTRDAVVTTFRGVKESLKVLRKLKVSLLPKKYAVLSLVPEPIAVAFLRKFFASEFARVGLAVHANNARDEMYFLASEFKVLVEQSGCETPNLDQLYAITEQAEEEKQILPEGSHSKPLNWRPIWISAGILTGILGAIGYLLSQRKRKK